jgi:hypothetical protein
MEKPLFQILQTSQCPGPALLLLIRKPGSLSSMDSFRMSLKLRESSRSTSTSVPIRFRRQFSRVVERFLATGSVQQKKPSGRPLAVVTDENAEIVDKLIESDPRISIRQICSKINLSVGSVWTILRRKLKMLPYKPKKVQPLTQAHKDQRVNFCDWISQQTPEFIDKVIWSDEKLWEEKVHPNRQNKRYWARVDPEMEVDCKTQGGGRR